MPVTAPWAGWFRVLRSAPTRQPAVEGVEG
jgi:hypothetical protein